MKAVYQAIPGTMSWTANGFTFDVAFVTNAGFSSQITVSVAAGTSQANWDNAVQTELRSRLLSEYGLNISANDLIKQ